jgi:hypothetical protein
VKHASDFARDHWQVAQLKPKFIEISVDMLKFVPFSHRAGMVFIGETEGNLRRVVKDLPYLLANQDRVNGDVVHDGACGIVDQQVSRMTNFPCTHPLMSFNGRWRRPHPKARTRLCKSSQAVSKILWHHH